MTLNSSLYDVREVAPRTWAISDHGMDVFYYLSGEDQGLLIDCGFGFGCLAELARGLDDKPLKLALTHGHPDHGCGAWQFDEVYLSPADQSVLERYCCAAWRTVMLATEGFRKDTETRRLFDLGFDGARWAAAPLPPSRFIKPGSSIDLGKRTLEVIDLAGHTPGSIGFLDRANRLLFSGDGVHCGQIWLQLPESGSLADFRAMLLRLAPYRAEFDWLLWGHSQDPAPAALIDDLIPGVEDVMAGRRKGTPHDWGEGEGLLIDFHSSMLLYKA